MLYLSSGPRSSVHLRPDTQILSRFPVIEGCGSAPEEAVSSDTQKTVEMNDFLIERDQYRELLVIEESPTLRNRSVSVSNCSKLGVWSLVVM